jgi:outer membrane protein assembly factor BamB
MEKILIVSSLENSKVIVKHGVVSMSVKRSRTVFNLSSVNIFFYTVILLCSLALAVAADQPQWGEKFTRNMVSQEIGLPTSFNIQKGENIKWSASLGNQNYASPTISNGRVLIGANNQSPRDPRHKGDYGVLLCLDEKDGSMLWQLAVPRVDRGDQWLDWPRVGLPSPPTIEGDRVYTLTNRFEVVCLDLNGQANGNDGPYIDEGKHMSPERKPAVEVTKTDADIIWLFDMPAEAGTYPHDAAHASILIDGRYLYINTCNGVDNTHKLIRKPDAPGLIVLDKETGRLIAKDNENIGRRTFHSTWSSPSLGVVNGKKMIFLGGGDGVCYAFEALEPEMIAAKEVRILKCIWRFECDPRPPQEDVHGDYGNTQAGPSSILGMPVFYENKIYVTFGGDIMQERRSKNLSWLVCIDATKTGDITASGQIWKVDLKGRCCSTPSIYNGMLFIADCAGEVRCLNVQNGNNYWTHQTTGDIWGSTLAADGKVYVGNRRGDFFVFEASREKKLINTISMRNLITSTPVAAKGILYIATIQTLYAINERE